MLEKKVKVHVQPCVKIHLKVTEHHLPYLITQCHLPPEESKRALPRLKPGRTVLDLPTPKD